MCKRCIDNSDILLGHKRFPLRCECECKELKESPQFRGYDYCDKCGDNVKRKKVKEFNSSSDYGLDYAVGKG